MTQSGTGPVAATASRRPASDGSTHAASTVGHPLLRLHGVHLAYEWADHPVLKDVDFEVRDGEAVLLLGPSGCGKSTLAMLCAGLIPDAVAATVTGEVWRHPDLQRPGAIGYIFQDPEAQLCMLRVGEEIAFGLENAARPRADMVSRIEHALREAGLCVAPLARHASFSGGMKQKLALACALAMHPRLLIADEPTANLDPQATAQVFRQLRRLHAAGQTMVIIEHKFEPLLPWVERVVLFDADGRVVASGPCRETVEKYADWLAEVGVLPAWKHWHARTAARTAGQDRSAPASQAVDAGDRKLRDASSPVPMPAAVELDEATLAYGDQPVWQGLNLTIPRGSFTAIVGPNGAGKSTLLLVMAGLRPLTAGRVALFGRPVRDWPARALREKVVLCFQNPEHQFVFERVADEWAGRLLGDSIPAEVHQALADHGLAGTAEQSPFALSQGQKRRLSVAVITREEHDLYLFDEPTFGQDARTQEALMERLATLHRAGKTVVISTHDMDLVRRFATQVVVLADGGILFEGTPEALWTRPDVMQQAHLLDDTAWAADVAEAGVNPPSGREYSRTLAGGDGNHEPQAGHGAVREEVSSDGWLRATPVRRRWPAPLRRINPAMQLVATLLAVGVAMFARNLAQSAATLLVPVLLAALASGIGPIRTIRRLAAFLIFYILYVWSFAAFSAVPPGTKVYHVLWFRLSWLGLYNGLVLAGRMLGGVALGLVLVSSVDISRFIEALCQNFRCPPKFAYGVLAGLRFVPLFREEWTKLRQARAMRGKAVAWWAQPVVYALPLLAQAIRMSERVAVAMEARGLTGRAAEQATARTYYWPAPVRPWDVAYAIGLPLVLASLLVVLRGV